MTEPIADIAFVSFNFNKGFGGHYLSMVETVRSGIFFEPTVLDLGFSPTPLLDDIRTLFIPYGWVGHAEARRQLRNFLLEAGTKVVFCYDIAAYNITQFALARDLIQVVYVKCGGPPLTLYYPKPENLVVYSDEDKRFFGEKLPNSVLAKIPNRVSESLLKKKQTRLSESALHELKKIEGCVENVEKIVCVARIGHAYEDKIRRAYDYLRATQAAGRPAVLAVIGSIQHEEVMGRLLDDRPQGTLFLSDAFHVNDAGRFLANFDTAITTGRGTVEATLVGLKVLVPFDHGKQLALLTPNNYHALIRSNFSGRAHPDELAEIMPPDFNSRDADRVRNLIRQDFAIEHAAGRFNDFLKRLASAKRPPTPELILGATYFFYVALRERSQTFRSLAMLRRRLFVRHRAPK
ncbi:hypothetical protein [Rhodobacter sp. NSM]|uniref:hypothetical protein n=1 Tax=Rhodobacter sp. NSM TaxID=3457501 RepID=UPI003FD4CB66